MGDTKINDILVLLGFLLLNLASIFIWSSIIFKVLFVIQLIIIFILVLRNLKGGK
jgi:hypothetical protein